MIAYRDRGEVLARRFCNQRFSALRSLINVMLTPFGHRISIPPSNFRLGSLRSFDMKFRFEWSTRRRRIFASQIPRLLEIMRGGYHPIAGSADNNAFATPTKQTMFCCRRDMPELEVSVYICDVRHVSNGVSNGKEREERYQ